MAWVEKLPSGKFRGGYIDGLGRKQQRGGFVHKKAAKQWADDGEEAARRGDVRDPNAGRTPFRDWAQRWQQARGVEATTAANEKPRFDEVVERWGDWPIAGIGSLEIQAWVKEMLKAGRSPATVRKYHGMLSVILGASMPPPHRLITENPCRHVTLPPVAKGREVYLTTEQVDAITAKLAEPWATLVQFLAYTGLRWGEASGLHANRIDWMRRQVTVAEVVIQTGSKFARKEYPKGTQPRHVPLPDHLLERLAEHVKAFPPPGCGLDHKGCSGLVFASQPRYPSAPRGPVSRQTFNRWIFTPAVTAAKAPKCRPHDLRHTYASWLVQSGVPLREVQYLLGHASITTTERYSHLAPDVGDAARRVLDRKIEHDLARGNFRGNDE